ncbi:MAG: tRNA 2-thiouridine(34) synthase MnmA [Deltaproteobacteria bacterium]|nr:tRNA 2-thiouridine(34) synthase MnmA [Deltaproteobacteria bacterium]
MTNKNKKVVVAMSGGVDSSVAAALLVEQGYDVVGISLQLWNYAGSDKGSFDGCCSPEDLYDARGVARQLRIPYYVYNFEQTFMEKVVHPFVNSYRTGQTPNPCVLCNEKVKFDPLLQRAKELEADYLATGHYAQVERDERGVHHLRKAKDLQKDQSYFLHRLTQEQLAYCLFPVGGMNKEEVRGIAKRLGLRVAEKPDSQEICFVANQNYASFVEEQSSSSMDPGPILDEEGHLLGTHPGLHRYTIGQRRGLGISSLEPLYVIRMDTRENRLIVGKKERLYENSFIVRETHWIDGEPQGPIAARVRIRYKHQEVPATTEPLPSHETRVLCQEPQRAITPGQAAVFYQGDQVLGGGWIERVGYE